MSLVELARYASAAEASVVQGRLEAAGVPAWCFDSGMNLAEGVPMLFRVRLMVLDDDLDAARAILGDDVDPVDMPADVEPEWGGADPAGRRKRQMARALFLYIAFFVVLAALLPLVLPRP
jgi:hypothetical protein